MTEDIKNIVIVGGGSAGWLVASILAARFKPSDLGIRITLVESPNVPSVGVGEGTWPSMRTTLKNIGISESEFIRECDASLKQGTWFKDWVAVGDTPYYHPFSLPEGFDSVNLAEHWLAGAAGDISFAEAVTPQFSVCENGRAPKQIGIPNYAYTVNYGYHLDAGKFAGLLTRNATQQLDVKHISADVTGVLADDEGYITAVQTAQQDEISGDLFIDCTGFQSLLLGQHYNVPLTSQRHHLFNNAAVAVQVPYADEKDSIAATTRSTAQPTVGCGTLACRIDAVLDTCSQRIIKVRKRRNKSSMNILNPRVGPRVFQDSHPDCWNLNLATESSSGSRIVSPSVCPQALLSP